METNSRKLIQKLKRDEWVLERVKGDHHIFKHPESAELITVTHPRKYLPVGQVRSIYRIAGWKL
jgi:predicted RNA binding protein YcfA (HicA-like mRNA interferase family)